MSVDAVLPAAGAPTILPPRPGLAGALSDLFWRRPRFLLVLMLLPPVSTPRCARSCGP